MFYGSGECYGVESKVRSARIHEEKLKRCQFSRTHFCGKFVDLDKEWGRHIKRESGKIGENENRCLCVPRDRY